jgi:hypothetical protein
LLALVGFWFKWAFLVIREKWIIQKVALKLEKIVISVLLFGYINEATADI